MTRFFLWTIGGLCLGLIIHLVVILTLPHFASHDLWDRIVAMTEPDQVLVLDPVTAGADNPLGLDPALAEAVCRLDLAKGPGVLSGALPDTFWSIAVFNAEGIAIYSTTHRASTNNSLNVGIFNPSQTRLLAQQEIGAQPDLLVVDSPGNEVFATVRVAPPHSAMLGRYREILKDLKCTNLKT